MKKKKKPGKKGNDGSALLNVLLTAEGRAPKAEGKKEIGGAARQSQRTALMFRKVRLRDDAAPWWGLSKWDESWVRDLKSFQLPKPEMDLSALGGGAFKKKSFVKPWAVEGREETSAYGWGWGGEGRLGQGVGRHDKAVPTLVNRAVEPRTGSTGRFVDVASRRRHTVAVEEGILASGWARWAAGQSQAGALSRGFE